MNMKHDELAASLHKSGMNCAQAVLSAFNDMTGLDEETALKLTSTFGGGMGRMGEVCGAVTGMFMAAGILLGHGNVPTPEDKNADAAMTRRLAERFMAQCGGSIICRELKRQPNPGETLLSCNELVRRAAAILDEELGLK